MKEKKILILIKDWIELYLLVDRKTLSGEITGDLYSSKKLTVSYIFDRDDIYIFVRDNINEDTQMWYYSDFNDVDDLCSSIHEHLIYLKEIFKK